MAEAGGRRRRHDRHRRHQGGRVGAPPTACTSPPPASAWCPAVASLGPEHVRPGDRVLVSGTIGDHGMAVMLARGDLALDADIRSDTASVAGLVELTSCAAAPGTRWMRDPTRGGVATVANELAHDTGLAIVLDEAALPVRPIVTGACDLLGIDPLYVANEGKVLAVVPAEEADAALAAMRAHPARRRGRRASARWWPSRRGSSSCAPPSAGTRIVDMLVGDPLPRIC